MMNHFAAPLEPGQGSAAVRDAVSGAAPAALPRGWLDVEEMPGDTLRLRPIENRKPLPCALGLAAMWLFIGGARWSSAHPHSLRDQLEASSIQFRVLLFGIPFTMLLLWAGWGREHWIVGPNRIELHRRVFFLRWGGRYKNRTLIIRLLTTSRSSSDHYLCIKKKHLFGMTRALIRQGERGSLADLVALSKFVSARTGWPLERRHKQE